jgi:hypothetical protein
MGMFGDLVFFNRSVTSGKFDIKRRRRTASLSFETESLETRQVLAVVSPVNSIGSAIAASKLQVKAAATFGQSMANYLQQQVNSGKRIGGGECAHLATEALRVAGAEFIRTEPAGTSDYVWSSNRIARLTKGSQLAGKVFQVGDIIQYQNATFSSGGTKKLQHHTQVVAAVDSKGRITQVFEQNVNGDRTAQKRAIMDLSKLTGGSVSVYRPVARKVETGRFAFTVVNNTSGSKSYSLTIGNKTTSYSIGKSNAKDSYKTHWVKYTGSQTPTIKVGSTSLTLRDAGAFEIYTNSSGSTSLRRI